MATVIFYNPVDMRSLRNYVAAVEERYPTQIIAREGELTINVFGAFNTAQNGNFTGTATKIDIRVSGRAVEEITDVSIPIAEIVKDGRIDISALIGPGLLKANDIIIGQGGSYFLGFGGDDSLSGGMRGDDFIDGGTGFDTVNYFSAASTFSITQVGGTYTLRNSDPIERSGTDTLVNIEKVRFLDANLALGQDSRAAQVYRLYEAAFDRAPDTPGLSFWMGQAESRWPPTRLAEAFMGSTEFITAYGAAPSNEALVDLLYRNVLDRGADSAGADYWNGRLVQGMTRAELLVHFAESLENRASVASDISNGILYADSFIFLL